MEECWRSDCAFSWFLASTWCRKSAPRHCPPALLSHRFKNKPHTAPAGFQAALFRAGSKNYLFAFALLLSNQIPLPDGKELWLLI
jgi:hypothetical protein